MPRGNFEKFDPNVRFYQPHEAPYSETNLKALEWMAGTWSLADCCLTGVDNADPTKSMTAKRRFGSDLNYLWFHFLRCELLIKVCSYKASPFPSSAPLDNLANFVDESNLPTVSAGIEEFNAKLLPTYIAQQPKFLTQAEQMLTTVWNDCVTLTFAKVPADALPEGMTPVAVFQAHVGFEQLNALLTQPVKPTETAVLNQRAQVKAALAAAEPYMTPELCELMLEVRMLISTLHEQRGQLRSAVAEILYAQMLFSHLASSSSSAGASSSAHGTPASSTRRVGDVKYWTLLRTRLCHLLERQGRQHACQTQVKAGLREAKSDVHARLQLLHIMAKSYYQQGRLLEVSQEGNEGCVPCILELLDLSYTTFPQSEPPLCVVQAKMLLHCALVQNPTFNAAKYLFAPKFKPKPPVPEDEEDFEEVARANAMKMISPVAAELLAIVDGTAGAGASSSSSSSSGGSSSSSSHAGSSTTASSSSENEGGPGGREQIGGSSASDALNKRSEKQCAFLMKLLEEASRDLDVILHMQGNDGDATNTDLNFLSHSLGPTSVLFAGDRPAGGEGVESSANLTAATDPALFVSSEYQYGSFGTGVNNGFRRRKKIFANLLPVAEHAFAWNSDKSHNDGRPFPNVYCKILRLRTALALQLADHKMQIAGRKDSFFDNIGAADSRSEARTVASFRAKHRSNASLQYLLECGELLKFVEANFKRLLFFPTRYFVQFCQLKLKYRRLAICERRVPRPFFESTDPVLEFHLRSGAVPDPLEVSLYRSFIFRTPGPTSLVRPSMRWTRDYSPEKLTTFLSEVHSLLHVASREGGHHPALAYDILFEALLEILRDWRQFADKLPRCNRLAQKELPLPESDVDQTVLPDHKNEMQRPGPGPVVDLEAETPVPESSILLRRLKNHFVGMVYVVFSVLKELADRRKKLQTSVVEIASQNADGGCNTGFKSFFAQEIENVNAGFRVQEDLFQHLLRQKDEGGLETFFKEGLAKVLPPTALAVLQYSLSVRKEVDATLGFDESTLLLADTLHLMCAKYLPLYENATVLPKTCIDTLKVPPALASSSATGYTALMASGGAPSGDSVPPGTISGSTFVDTQQILLHYTLHPITSDADEDKRTKVEDVKGLDLTTLACCKDSDICFFWSQRSEESNVVDYGECACSCVILLRDFAVVYKVRGFIDRQRVRRCYDLWAVMQKNAQSPVLEGFTRKCFVEVLAAFCDCFFDRRQMQLEALLPPKEDAGISNEAAQIARNERKGFTERSDVVQDHFEDLPEIEEEAPPPPPPPPKPKQKSGEEIKEEYDARASTAIDVLLDSIGYMPKIDTYTGEKVASGDDGEVELDRDVLEPVNAKKVIDSVVTLLCRERRCVSTQHKDVSIFLRSFLPEESMEIKEVRYY
ncbi:unnamed protein product [Amoebophrya sp. A25]|nr:unnamed protein product [Amoebophrya sp. A25]|eukprot:GSA25T00016880001.1